MPDELIDTLTVDDVNRAIRAIVGPSETEIQSAADVPAYVLKHKPAVEPILNLLRRSPEFQRFADGALDSIMSASRSSSKMLRPLYFMTLRAVFYAGAIAGFDAANRRK